MKVKSFEKINDLKVINFKSKILQHTVNLKFFTKAKCFYDINFVKDLMCKLNHVSDVLPL